MGCDEYVGEKLKFVKNIDGSQQNFELYVFDSPEDESYVLQMDGIYTDLRIEINFCPICGRKL